MMGLWFGPMVMVPVTPAKSLVAARAWATLAPSRPPAWFMAAARRK